MTQKKNAAPVAPNAAPAAPAPEAPEAPITAHPNVRTNVTTWRNPTNRTVKLRLFHGLGAHGDKFLIVTLPPGSTAEIPSEYDEAIRPSNEHMTHGGLGPQLQKL